MIFFGGRRRTLFHFLLPQVEACQRANMTEARAQHATQIFVYALAGVALSGESQQVRYNLDLSQMEDGGWGGGPGCICKGVSGRLAVFDTVGGFETTARLRRTTSNINVMYNHRPRVQLTLVLSSIVKRGGILFSRHNPPPHLRLHCPTLVGVYGYQTHGGRTRSVITLHPHHRPRFILQKKQQLTTAAIPVARTTAHARPEPTPSVGQR